MTLAATITRKYIDTNPNSRIKGKFVRPPAIIEAIIDRDNGIIIEWTYIVTTKNIQENLVPKGSDNKQAEKVEDSLIKQGYEKSIISDSNQNHLEFIKLIEKYGSEIVSLIVDKGRVLEYNIKRVFQVYEERTTIEEFETAQKQEGFMRLKDTESEK